MSSLLSMGLRVLGVAGAACFASAVSFYIVVMTGFSNRYVLPNRLYEGLFLATVGLGGAALISALTPKHRLTLILLGLDGALVLATVLISAVDQAQHPSRRRVQALAYQERIATLSQGHLQCAEGYEVHRLPQGQLLYFQRGNGDLPVQVLAHQAWLQGQCEVFTRALDREQTILQSCTNDQGERLEDWLAALRAAPCPEF